MKAKRQRIEGMLYREIQFRTDGIIDEDERRVKISISSETPIVRKSFFSDPWIETLGHKRGEPNLARFQSGGASVHYNHSRQRADRIGVVESVKLVTIKDGTRAEGKDKMRRLEGVVRISKREDVDDIWTDISDGVLRNISVGYTVDERKLTRESGPG